VFTAQLLSNAREVNHRKHRSPNVALVHFLGNVFRKPLSSNELLRLSGFMSEHLNIILGGTE
jgi:hypothetical protein